MAMRTTVETPVELDSWASSSLGEEVIGEEGPVPVAVFEVVGLPVP